MIKLIASDVDGTLVKHDGDNAIDKNIYSVIEECKKRNIVFAVASGRSYANLKKVFLPVWRDVFFVAENGNAIIYNDRIIHEVVIPRELVKEIIDHIKDLPDCNMNIATPMKMLLFSEPRWFFDMIMHGTKNAAIVLDSFDEVLEEDIIKISAFIDLESLDKRAEEFKRIWGEKMVVTKSGSGWVDFSLSGKGAAIRRIMDDFNITKDETMVFGDNYNDIEMFGAATHSYAMNGADDAVKAWANYTTDVVSREIQYYLDTGEVRK